MKYCEKCKESRPDDAACCPECGIETGTFAATDTSSPMITIGGMPTLNPDDVAQPVSSHELEPGDEFASRYTIEGCIGRGGMGVVYRAHEKATGRKVALKLIRPGRAFSQSDLDQLVTEGVTAREIRDPNVVAVYEVGQQDGQPFVTMELVQGVSLRTFIREQAKARKTIPAFETIRIIRRILTGLKAAHAKGVIHRDLKPENVMICGSGDNLQVRILDFGIAQAVENSGSGHRRIGTQGYMAPEQRTQADLVGPEADLYSVSVMFYELLVGVLPQGHWQPPSSGRSDVHPFIDTLIEQGVSNNRAKRPQSAEEYLHRLPEPPRAMTPANVMNQAVVEVVDVLEHSSVATPRQKKSGYWVGGVIVGLGVMALSGMFIFALIVVLALVDSEDSPGSQSHLPVTTVTVESSMPNVLDMDLEDAMETLGGQGYYVVYYGTVDGYVASQDPPPGILLESGARVRIWLE